MLAVRSELDRHQFRGAFAHAVADVVAMNDEGVAALVSAAYDEMNVRKMNVRIVGIPVIESDPIQLCPEIALHLLDEVAGEGAEVLHLGCVFGTDDKPKMMAIIAGALGEGAQLRVV